MTAMFARDLAIGSDPEALYTKTTVESVSIRGCRSKLNPGLYYPGRTEPALRVVVGRPFDWAAAAGLAHTKHQVPGRTSPPGASRGALAATQYAPRQFVGDDRVGGMDTRCGIRRTTRRSQTVRSTAPSPGEHTHRRDARGDHVVEGDAGPDHPAGTSRDEHPAFGNSTTAAISAMFQMFGRCRQTANARRRFPSSAGRLLGRASLMLHLDQPDDSRPPAAGRPHSGTLRPAR